MRRFATYIIFALLVLAQPEQVVGYPPGGSASEGIEQYIKELYGDIKKLNGLKYDVFKKGYVGYLNLQSESKLPATRHIITVCDFSMSANKKRMWIIDLDKKKLLLNTHVAHGQGTGEEYANKFSNLPNSHQSSMGFYVTGATYTGKHGNSLRLLGMDKGYNCAALDRAIVLHGAEYVSEEFIKNHKRLGRSWGCPAVSVDVSDKVIGYIKGGTCLFIYYPAKQYLTDSYWLNKSPDINTTVVKKDMEQHHSDNNKDVIQKVIRYEYPLAE